MHITEYHGLWQRFTAVLRGRPLAQWWQWPFETAAVGCEWLGRDDLECELTVFLFVFVSGDVSSHNDILESCIVLFFSSGHLPIRVLQNRSRCIDLLKPFWGENPPYSYYSFYIYVNLCRRDCHYLAIAPWPLHPKISMKWLRLIKILQSYFWYILNSSIMQNKTRKSYMVLLCLANDIFVSLHDFFTEKIGGTTCAGCWGVPGTWRSAPTQGRPGVIFWDVDFFVGLWQFSWCWFNHVNLLTPRFLKNLADPSSLFKHIWQGVAGCQVQHT